MHSPKGKEVLVKTNEKKCWTDHAKCEMGTTHNEETNAKHWNEGKSLFASIVAATTFVVNQPFAMISALVTSVFSIYTEGVTRNERVQSMNARIIMMVMLFIRNMRTTKRHPVRNSIDQVMTLTWILMVRVWLLRSLDSSFNKSLTPLPFSNLENLKIVI